MDFEYKLDMAQVEAVHRALCYDNLDECFEERGLCVRAVRAIAEMGD